MGQRVRQEVNAEILTEVVRERITSQEADKTIQLSDTVLQGSTRETPLVLRLELKARLRSVRRALLDVVGLVKLDKESEHVQVAIA